MKYDPTFHNYDLDVYEEPQEIRGYQKQFSISTPRGATSTTVTTPITTETPAAEEPFYTDSDLSILQNGGTRDEMERVATKYFSHEEGLKDYQAAAIAGAITSESNFRLNAENKEEKAGKNPAVNPTKYGLGILQWTGSRHDAYKKFVSEHGGIPNFKTQLDFIRKELNDRPEYLENLRKAKNVREATQYTYTQYVNAEFKNVNADNVDAYTNKVQNMYRKNHTITYGKAGPGDFSVRFKNAERILNNIHNKQWE